MTEILKVKDIQQDGDQLVVDYVIYRNPADEVLDLPFVCEELIITPPSDTATRVDVEHPDNVAAMATSRPEDYDETKNTREPIVTDLQSWLRDKLQLIGRRAVNREWVQERRRGFRKKDSRSKRTRSKRGARFSSMVKERIEL